MPRYLFAAAAVSRSSRDAAVGLATTRFPEVAVEVRYSAHDDGSDVWVCRAPSVAHVQRWAAAAGLAVDHLQHVDADEPSIPVTVIDAVTEPGGSR